MLLSMHEYIQYFANTISTVTGLDMEVVDTKLTRVAGTGVYAGDIGKNIKSAGNLLKTTLVKNIPIFIDNPRENSICDGCQNKKDCKELLSMCAPITDGTTVYGAMELVCFSSQARKRLLLNPKIYIHFLSFLASTIADRCRERQELSDISELLDVMFQVVNTTGKGTILHDADGHVVYHNDRADTILQEFDPSQIEKSHITPTGTLLADFEEFSIEHKGKCQIVVGKSMVLSAGTARFNSVFVFDTVQSLLSPSLTASPVDFSSSINQIIGKSPQILHLKQQISATAGTNSSVLITGESGTGKELVARAIHATGDRGGAPFIAVNCGAIPDTLLESELFGYAGGAFTGALRKGQVGKFEMAEGGVLFLDEISSMPLYLQVKLLRALQERVITRLGATKAVKVNIRVIAACNDNLPELLAQNKFRHDLYYRLNVIPVQIAPLRARMEDLDLLIPYFINKYCSLFNKAPLKLSSSLLGKMRKYNWPGNVRELENSIEYLVNMADEIGNINESTLYHGFLIPHIDIVHINSEYEDLIPLHEMEQRAIAKAIELYGNNTEGKKQSARALGISLATLYRKLAN